MASRRLLSLFWGAGLSAFVACAGTPPELAPTSPPVPDAADVPDVATVVDAAPPSDVTPPSDASGDVFVPTFPIHDDLYDYFVQDVCVSGAGVLPDDPATCVSHRNLEPGEVLPYHKFDQPDSNNPYGFQIGDSYAMRDAAGRVRYVSMFDNAFAGTDRAFFEFDEKADGYDIAQADTAYASYVGTRDATGGVQPMWSFVPGGKSCTLADAWLLFPRAFVVSEAPGAAVAHLRIAPTCPTALVDAYTAWSAADVTYTSGKTVHSLISSHYGGTSVGSADHIERFYYTRLYGRMRWERWQKGGAGKASGCNGPVTDKDGFTRVDCREWSNLAKDPQGGTDPHVVPIDGAFAHANLLSNGGFGKGTGDISPWQRSTDTTTNWSILAEPYCSGATKSCSGQAINLLANNRHLAFNCIGPCTTNAIFQDVPRGGLATGTPLRFGARLWADATAAPAAVSVAQLRGDGSVIRADQVDASLDATRALFTGALVVDTDCRTFRFAVHPGANGFDYWLDDAWLSE